MKLIKGIFYNLTSFDNRRRGIPRICSNLSENCQPLLFITSCQEFWGQYVFCRQCGPADPLCAETSRGFQEVSASTSPGPRLSQVSRTGVKFPQSQDSRISRFACAEQLCDTYSCSSSLLSWPRLVFSPLLLLVVVVVCVLAAAAAARAGRVWAAVIGCLGRRGRAAREQREEGAAAVATATPGSAPTAHPASPAPHLQQTRQGQGVSQLPGPSWQEKTHLINPPAPKQTDRTRAL